MTLSNNFRRNRNVGIVAIVIALLIIALVGSLYLRGNSPTLTPTETMTPNPISFDYHLDVSPTNSTIMQGNSVQIQVTISYVQGSPENITLSAIGIPDRATYTFSQLQGFPSNNSTFNSTLIINVSETVPTDSYSITVNSTSDNGKTYSSSYILSVLSSKISVSGTVNGGTGVVPTQIVFEQLSATGATTETFTVPVQSGEYVISLPNKQFYAVSVTWESLDGSSGTQQFIQPYGVNAGVGISSVNCPFSWGP